MAYKRVPAIEIVTDRSEFRPPEKILWFHKGKTLEEYIQKLIEFKPLVKSGEIKRGWYNGISEHLKIQIWDWMIENDYFTKKGGKK